MASFYIENFGCRATDADASALRHRLQADGWRRVAEHQGAELVVLNTCTVTATADSQAREAVRKIHRANPNARIVVTGCYAQRAPEELAGLAGVVAVVGNARQDEIPRIARAGRDTGDFVPVGSLLGKRTEAPIIAGDVEALTSVQSGASEAVEGDSTRPILKVQDGCANRCAYCIIPFVRGQSRSLPPDEVIGAVNRWVAAGAREIVLSGINLGSYGRDFSPRASLAALVDRILCETQLEQLRFSSIEAQHVTADFASLVASSGRIAPHFHIPLQSGSDRVLHAMHRWYRTAHYAERVCRIREMLPHAAIGADVIAGFPGETEADFEQTLAFVRELPLTYLHPFSFSVRPGSEAARLENALPSSLIRERARALRAMSAQKSAAFRACCAGGEVRALTLAGSQDGWTEALTGNYFKVRIAGRHAANQWRWIRPTVSAEDILVSAPVSGRCFAEPSLVAR
jgi:threonylcarbamoyladenosine tRNA methylthiotransferase MtaB